jgi:hypothetical protein
MVAWPDMASSWKKHGQSLAQHGQNMATIGPLHGNPRKHGKSMTTSWQTHGKNIDRAQLGYGAAHGGKKEKAKTKPMTWA